MILHGLLPSSRAASMPFDRRISWCIPSRKEKTDPAMAMPIEMETWREVPMSAETEPRRAGSTAPMMVLLLGG